MTQSSRIPLLIKGKAIQKYYGQLHVLKGVDIEVKKGEIVSIVGKSGAGKSTLLHIIGTLDEMDEGQITYTGADIKDLNPKQLAAFRNKNIGFIFQFHHLLPEFTALENTCIPAYIGKGVQKTVEKSAKEILDYMGLSERLNHKPGELSGGEQQRVAIARALINKPQIVLADEPTGNLDTGTSDEIHDLLFQMRNDFGQTFVIVTHNEELAMRCDRMLTMADGLIID